MKIIALGDIHGRSIWKKIISMQSFDKLVFIGDYFDTKENISPEIQIENFLEIYELKKSRPEDVVLLLGNHDYHYLDGITEEYTGYQPQFHDPISNALNQGLKDGLIQLCFRYENILFTHAGISKTWCFEHNLDMQNIERSINSLFNKNPVLFGYHPDLDSDDAATEGVSPIWIRPDRLRPDSLDGFIQVVGHTMQSQLVHKRNVYYIDVLGTSGEYLVIDNGHFSVAKF